MIRMRFYGRGGLGAVTGAVLLGKSVRDREALLFPLYGVERRGAPVSVFLYIDDKKITKREPILKDSDFDVVFDEGLLGTEYKKSIGGLKKDGFLIVNTSKSPEELAEKFEFLKGHNLAVVPAFCIALKNKVVTGTGAAINTAILGAVSRVTKIISLDDLVDPIKEEFGSNAEKNINAAKEAYRETKFRIGGCA